MTKDLEEQRQILKELVARRDEKDKQLRSEIDKARQQQIERDIKVEELLFNQVADKLGVDIQQLEEQVEQPLKPEQEQRKLQSERLAKVVRDVIEDRKQESQLNFDRSVKGGAKNLIKKRYHNPSVRIAYATEWEIDIYENPFGVVSGDDPESAAAGGTFDTVELPEYGFGREGVQIINPWARASAGSSRRHGFAEASVTQRLTFQTPAPDYGRQWGVEQVVLFLEAFGMGRANSSSTFFYGAMSRVLRAGGEANLYLTVRVDQLAPGDEWGNGDWGLVRNDIVVNHLLATFVSRGATLIMWPAIVVPMASPPMYGAVSIPHSPAISFARPFIVWGEAGGGGLIDVHVELTCAATAEYRGSSAEITFNDPDFIRVRKVILSGDSYVD